MREITFVSHREVISRAFLLIFQLVTRGGVLKHVGYLLLHLELRGRKRSSHIKIQQVTQQFQ